MKERPILFSGAMVNALLAGTKTQTRRILKPNPPHGRPVDHVASQADGPNGAWWVEPGGWVKCPYGQPGDCLWVRETWRAWALVGAGDLWRVEHQADGSVRDHLIPLTWNSPKSLQRQPLPWVPSIFIPRWASRLTLEVTEVRVDRGPVSDVDALAEGIGIFSFGYSWPGHCVWYPAASLAYTDLFETINGPGSIDKWRWAISFRVVSSPA